MAIGDPPIFSGGILGGIGAAPDMWKHINATDMKEQLMRDMAQAQMQHNANAQAQASAVPMFPAPPPPPPPPLNLAGRAREMFLKRMGGIRAELRIAEGDYLQCHVYGEVVHVFYCFGGRPGVAQESIDLFPSDQLITQFRIILAC
jgi:hypothetical protein